MSPVSDANGVMVWTDPKDNFAYDTDYSTQNYTNNDIWQEISNTITLNIETNDLIIARVEFDARLTEGNSSDTFNW